MYSAVLAGAEAIGIQQGLADLGVTVRIRLGVDNQALVDHSARVGYGVAKHVAIRWLWLQRAVQAQRLAVVKVPTRLNSADQLTKPLREDLVVQHTIAVGGQFANADLKENEVKGGSRSAAS